VFFVNFHMSSTVLPEQKALQWKCSCTLQREEA